MFNYKKKYLKYIKKYYNLVNEINQDGGKSPAPFPPTQPGQKSS